MMLPAFITPALAATVTQIPSVSALTDPLTSLVSGPGGDRPITSFRFDTNGDILEATGDTGSALSFSKVGEWVSPIGGLDASKWEVLINVTAEDVGDPGTWTGSTLESYQNLSTQKTFTWTKDGSDIGTAESTITVTIRNIDDTSNSVSRSGIDHQTTITS